MTTITQHLTGREISDAWVSMYAEREAQQRAMVSRIAVYTILLLAAVATIAIIYH